MSFRLTAEDRAKLRNLHPHLVRVVERAAEITPIPFRITEGLRSPDRQKKLVAAGASKTMNSRHLTGHAVDLVPLVDLNGNGKFETSELFHWPLYYKLAPVIKQAAKDCGVPIEWGGDWKTFKDGPHWQLPWSSYPTARGLIHEAQGEPRYTSETEQAARVKEGAAAGALGSTATASTIGPVIPDIMDALKTQQAELTSGDWVRIAVAGVIVALTIYAVWRKVRS